MVPFVKTRIKKRFIYRTSRFRSTACPDRNVQETFKIASEFESIAGERGPKPSRRSVRYVYHRKIHRVSFNPLKVTSEGYDFFCGQTTVKAYNPHVVLLSNEPSLLANIIASGSDSMLWIPDIDTVVDTAIDNIYRPPSLINAIAEAGEIPELLLAGWKKLKMLNLPPGTNLQSLLRLARSPNKLADLMADTVLTTNLGILPTFSEILSITEMVRKGVAAYEQARRTVEKQGGFRVSKTKEIDISFDHTWPTGSYAITGKTKRIYGAYASAKFPNGGLPDLSSFAAVGLNWDFQTLWNMLPMTFLIDYFVPVGEALRRARLYTDLVITDGWKSDLMQGSFSGRSTQEFGYSGSGTPATHGGEYRIYRRDRHLWDVPDGISVKDYKLFPSARQLSNISALGRVLTSKRG